MKSKLPTLALLAGLIISSAVVAADRPCPKADTFLGQTVGGAKKVLSSQFPDNWEVNGPLCPTGYSNLMTLSRADLCETPVPVDKIIVGGSADSNEVISVSYVLPEVISPVWPHPLISRIKNERTAETDQIPEILRPLLRNDLEMHAYLLSSTGRYFVRATVNGHRTLLTIFDLQAIDAQRSELLQCMKEKKIIK